METEQRHQPQRYRQVESKECATYDEATEVARTRAVDLGLLKRSTGHLAVVSIVESPTHRIRRRKHGFDVITFRALDAKE